MTQITYIEGDVTYPIKTPAVIAHVCNDIGKWGAGFVLAISRRWENPEKEYREWYKNKVHTLGIPFQLGQIQYVKVENDLCVCNMVAQHRIGGVAIKYEMLDKCLNELGGTIQLSTKVLSVHMPRIGCGLAGGKWDKVEPLIIKNLCEKDIEVFAYDL